MFSLNQIILLLLALLISGAAAFFYIYMRPHIKSGFTGFYRVIKYQAIPLFLIYLFSVILFFTYYTKFMLEFGFYGAFLAASLFLILGVSSIIPLNFIVQRIKNRKAAHTGKTKKHQS
jgi:hypothetical protein